MGNTAFYIAYAVVTFALAFFMARVISNVRGRMNELERSVFEFQSEAMDIIRNEKRLLESHFNTSWPVKQVILTVTAESHHLTRDLVRYLNQAVSVISGAPFPAQFGTIEMQTETTGGIHVTVQRQLCKSPPGFFGGCAGSVFPAELYSLSAAPQERGKRTVTVFAQVTKHGSTAALVSYLSQSIHRLEAGEQVGADYDDDNGYAFIISSAITL